ncbi:TPA: hypothetical protein ACGD2U_002414, partial [Aeromonas veronii]
HTPIDLMTDGIYQLHKTSEPEFAHNGIHTTPNYFHSGLLFLLTHAFVLDYQNRIKQLPQINARPLQINITLIILKAVLNQ